MYACPKRRRNLTARSDADGGRTGVRRGGGFSEWGRLCCEQRSRREGGLAGPSGLTAKREGERVGVLVGGFVRGNHTEVRRELIVEVFSLPTADVQQ